MNAAARVVSHVRDSLPVVTRLDKPSRLTLCAFLRAVTIDFPIIADPTREISVKYGMLDPSIKVRASTVLLALLFF